MPGKAELEGRVLSFTVAVGTVSDLAYAWAELRAYVPRRFPMANVRKPPPTVKQLCEGVDPNAKHEHLAVCPACGQMFDCRHQAEVAHHSAPDHSPKLK